MMNELTKQEFETEVLKGVQEAYPDAEVVIEDVKKTNGVFYRGLRIIQKLSVVVDLDFLYDKYASGNVINVTDIIDLITKELENQKLPDGINLDHINDYEKIKTSLIPFVIDAERNAAMISEYELVTFPYLDLSIGFVIYYQEANATIKVTKKLTDMWSITTDDLYAQAYANIKENYLFDDIGNLMFDINNKINEEGTLPDVDELIKGSSLSIAKNGFMFILKNHKMLYGAAHIANTELLNTISQYMSSDFYILPSSIHELVLVKDYGCERDNEELKSMVIEINETEVDPREVLSNSVYKYSREENKVFKVA